MLSNVICSHILYYQVRIRLFINNYISSVTLSFIFIKLTFLFNLLLLSLTLYNSGYVVILNSQNVFSHLLDSPIRRSNEFK